MIRPFKLKIPSSSCAKEEIHAQDEKTVNEEGKENPIIYLPANASRSIVEFPHPEGPMMA